MLITAQPLVEVVPLEHATKPGVVVAQWNKDSVEDAGLIKIDLLSLRTLGMLTEVCALIEGRCGRKLDLDALPLDDPAVYKLLAAGDTIGCFQVESRAQSSMLPRLRPRCFADLVIEVSIVRPGPIQGGMVHPYLRRRNGQEPVTYLDARLEPILRETLGVIIFQEQVIRVAVALAGFTPGEADLLRRAMSRSRSAEAMGELRVRFLAGAQANGVDASVAEEAFRQLQGFATYGFCKSHAASFALIAYQTLWLKAHHPAELYCALLNHQPMGFYTPEVVIGDAKRHGITVLRPDVNASQDGCLLEPRSGGSEEIKRASASASTSASASASTSAPLRLGLRYLHGLGEAGRARLLTARANTPFADLADFCRRTRLPRPLVGDLIRAGALDGFGSARRQQLWVLGGLQYQAEVLVEAPDVTADLPDLSEGEAMTWDYELLGLSPDDHPLRLLRAGLRARGMLDAAELAAQPSGKTVKVAGMVVVRQAPPTAKGHLFITLEDETGLINLIIRPDLYAREQKTLHGAAALMVAGRLQREDAALSVLVQALYRLDTRVDRWEKAAKLDPGGSGRRGKEALEVGALGEAHGVIDGVAGAVDLVQGAACLLRRPVHRRVKALGAHPAGARGHHQRPARRQDAQRQPREARIGCERAAHLVFALGERRRIDDHQAKALPAPAQIGESRERVGCQHGMARGGHCREVPVEREVALGSGQRGCAGVEAQHLGRAAPRGVEGKAAGVGENVQRAPARGQLAHARPVIALVEEEPRLLPPQHVGLEM